MKQKFLTIAEAAQRVRRTEKGLRLLIFRGKFPFSKIGGKIYVEEAELDKYLLLSRQVTAETAVKRKIVDSPSSD